MKAIEMNVQMEAELFPLLGRVGRGHGNSNHFWTGQNLHINIQELLGIAITFLQCTEF